MFLKRVFYASAALLCLALTFTIGARFTSAQSSAAPVDVGWSPLSQTAFAGFSNGDWYEWDGSTWAYRSNVFGGAPAGRTLVALDGDLGAGRTLFAIASNGEVFVLIRDVAPYPFASLGVPSGGPMATTRESWGAVRARFRSERGAGAQGR